MSEQPLNPWSGEIANLKADLRRKEEHCAELAGHISEIATESDAWKKACGDVCPKCASVNPETGRATDSRDLAALADLRAMVERQSEAIEKHRGEVAEMRATIEELKDVICELGLEKGKTPGQHDG